MVSRLACFCKFTFIINRFLLAFCKNNWLESMGYRKNIPCYCPALFFKLYTFSSTLDFAVSIYRFACITYNKARQ